MPYKDKEEMRTYQREWMRTRRIAFFEGRTCEICSRKKNLGLFGGPAHRGFMGWGQDKIAELMKQSRVLCRKCGRRYLHFIKTGWGQEQAYGLAAEQFARETVPQVEQWSAGEAGALAVRMFGRTLKKLADR